MHNINLNDTIAAIASPIGESGIGIVRLSGKDALAVTDKVFISKDGKKPSTFKTYTMHYGWIIDRRASRQGYAIRNTQYAIREIIDEVILTVMRAPKSYTKEDVVEINCHGGIIALRAVLDLVLDNGCRMADPGEFTKRAFLNGRIDLAQAEAVLDIIRAKTDSALRMGTEQLKGAVSRQINNLRKALLDILAPLEANIDFPEEEIGSLDLQRIGQAMKNIDRELKSIIEGAKHGRIMREGIQAVICGKPNVGKSSLLNALLRQERSIVSSVPGTTRDTIEEIIDIKGIPVRIVDTAGIIEPRDLVENKAVKRSQRYIASADLIILLFDGSKRLTGEDNVLIRKTTKKPVLAVINKIDLRQRIEKSAILKKFDCAVEVSAKKNKNIDLLEDAVVNLVYKGKISSAEPVLFSNLRHISAIKEAKKLIEEAINSLDNKVTLEFISQDVKEALGCFDRILGRGFSDELLDRIFSEFCIGK